MARTLSVGFACVLAYAAAAAPDSRPNLVVVTVDDLDVATTEVMLSVGLLPHLQRDLAEAGFRFNQSFVTDSLCSPSRATFLTGQYAHNHGVRGNGPPLGGMQAFDDRSTLATWLRDGGYRTGLVGKYLNGYGATNPTYVPPGWDDWRAVIDNAVYDYRVNENGTIVTYGSDAGDYQTDVLGRHAGTFIRESHTRFSERPFFLWITPLAPHFEGPPGGWAEQWQRTIRPAPRHAGTIELILPSRGAFNETDIRDKPAWVRRLPPLAAPNINDLKRQHRDRLTALRAVDDLLGDVAGALRETGQLERTVLVFTSDNGWLLGEHRLSGKKVAYEESIRVPLFIRVPGRPGPQSSERFALNNDLASTLSAFADIPPGLPPDGRSLVPLFADPKLARWRRRFLVEHWPDTVGASAVEPPAFVAIRTAGESMVAPNQIYVDYRAKDPSVVEHEQYSLVDDPLQLRSLHAETAPQRRRDRTALAAWLSALQRCAGARCREIEDE